MSLAILAHSLPPESFGPLWAWILGSMLFILGSAWAADRVCEVGVPWTLNKRPIPGSLFAMGCAVPFYVFGFAPIWIVSASPLCYTLCWLTVWVASAWWNDRSRRLHTSRGFQESDE